MDLTNEERERLKAFRVVARQVRESSVIDRGLRVEVRIVGPVGEGPHTLAEETLPEEAFRSLALAIRLVYGDSQEAHFYRVCNVLRKEFGEARAEGALGSCDGDQGTIQEDAGGCGYH